MMFHTVAGKEIQGRIRLHGQKYHKNGDCAAVADSEYQIVVPGPSHQLEPCGICYPDKGGQR